MSRRSLPGSLPPGSKVLIVPPAVRSAGAMNARSASGPRAGLMNKTETAYAQHLATLVAAGVLTSFAFEPVKLLVARIVRTFADGTTRVESTWYTPDFRVIRPDGSAEYHDVKGAKGDRYYAREDAMLKIRTVARLHPEPIRIAWPIRGGGWATELIRGTV